MIRFGPPVSEEEALLVRSRDSMHFEFGIDNVVPPIPKGIVEKRTSDIIVEHGQQYEMPHVYLKSVPIHFTIENVKVHFDLNPIQQKEEEKQEECQCTFNQFKPCKCAYRPFEPQKSDEATGTVPPVDPNEWSSFEVSYRMDCVCKRLDICYCCKSQIDFQSNLRFFDQEGNDILWSKTWKFACEEDERWKLKPSQRTFRFLANLQNLPVKFRTNLWKNNSIVISTVLCFKEELSFISINPEVPNSVKAHQKLMRDILFKGIKSDFVIKVNGENIQCHKAILEAHSAVFETMFSVGMSESTCNEVIIEDMTVIGVKALLEYMYTGNISHLAEDLLITFELLRASHKYSIPALLESCKLLLYYSNFEYIIDVETAIEIFAFVHQSGQADLEILNQKCLGLFKFKSKCIAESKRYRDLMMDEYLRDVFINKMLSYLQFPSDCASCKLEIVKIFCRS